MMRSALVDDSWTPLMLDHQKNSVVTTPKKVANRFGSI